MSGYIFDFLKGTKMSIYFCNDSSGRFPEFLNFFFFLSPYFPPSWRYEEKDIPSKGERVKIFLKNDSREPCQSIIIISIYGDLSAFLGGEMQLYEYKHAQKMFQKWWVL